MPEWLFWVLFAVAMWPVGALCLVSIFVIAPPVRRKIRNGKAVARYRRKHRRKESAVENP